MVLEENVEKEFEFSEKRTPIFKKEIGTGMLKADLPNSKSSTVASSYKATEESLRRQIKEKIDSGDSKAAAELERELKNFYDQVSKRYNLPIISRDDFLKIVDEVQNYDDNFAKISDEIRDHNSSLGGGEGMRRRKQKKDFENTSKPKFSDVEIYIHTMEDQFLNDTKLPGTPILTDNNVESKVETLVAERKGKFFKKHGIDGFIRRDGMDITEEDQLREKGIDIDDYEFVTSEEGNLRSDTNEKLSRKLSL